MFFTCYSPRNLLRPLSPLGSRISLHFWCLKQAEVRGGLQGLEFSKFFPRFVVSNLGCKWFLVSTANHCLVWTFSSVEFRWRWKPSFPKYSLNTFTHLFPHVSLCFCLSHHTSDISVDGSVLGRKRAGNLTLYCKLHGKKTQKSASWPNQTVSDKHASKQGRLNGSSDWDLVVSLQPKR